MKFGVFDHLDRGNAELGDMYAQRLDCIELYDRLGFYGYHLAEHHGTPLGMTPSPAVFLVAVAQRTQRLRFGPLVYLLPLYHPIRLAEEIAMLDQLGHGRLDVGVGRGRSPIELRNFGRDPATTEAVFDETLEILRSALATGAVEFSGRHFTFSDVAVETRPYQQPHPPFWYGIGSPDGAERCVERGFNIVTNAKPAIAEQIGARFLPAMAKANKKLMFGVSRFIVVADTTEEALTIARRSYANWYHSFNYLNAKAGTPPPSSWQLQSWHPTFDGMAADGLAIAGSPAAVTAELESQLTQIGANYCVGQMVFGDMTARETRRSIELFASGVMPAFG